MDDELETLLRDHYRRGADEIQAGPDLVHRLQTAGREATVAPVSRFRAWTFPVFAGVLTAAVLVAVALLLWPGMPGRHEAPRPMGPPATGTPATGTPAPSPSVPADEARSSAPPSPSGTPSVTPSPTWSSPQPPIPSPTAKPSAPSASRPPASSGPSTPRPPTPSDTGLPRARKTAAGAASG
ncbi:MULTISPECIES: hypothetical protein [Thermomonosporaceae]|uniref:hypothetical protein n=1 Tax=Thermomonosporaceae TaxID=2012 RepID=UPI00255B141B|nr:MULTISPECIES: hypothetical protein [Thermomonosporaceae]MDL4775659.1 hypothetical protein [Actinomadura xylanilytica]